MSHRKGPRPKRENKQWTPAELARLAGLAKGNTPTGLIADALGRTENAIYNKAADEGISLKPTNKSPYTAERGNEPVDEETRDEGVRHAQDLLSKGEGDERRNRAFVSTLRSHGSLRRR